MRLNSYRLAPVLAAVLLAGCGDSDVKEINQWMDEVKATTKTTVVPLAEPKTFIPFAYELRDQTDPYDPNKLLAELARQAATSNNPLRPDMDRRKEFLESFPLDVMRMVGTIQKGGVNYALVQIDRQLHQIKPGQRIGPNYGMVTGVTDVQINVKETVQDAGGEWVERTSKLELQESKEIKK